MKRCIVLDKNVGETPLTTINAWKSRNPDYAGVTACYAGRLDPMASGKLLVLLGDECKRLRDYASLDKEYEIEVLLDVESDTGDALGMPTPAVQEARTDESSVALALARELGAHVRAYPVFSSKTVGGKPLFLHALEGALHTIEVPTHIERIYRIRPSGTYTLSSAELERRVMEFLSRVPHTAEPSKRLGRDFRVDAIREKWQALFDVARGKSFVVIRMKVICASGAYMRALAGRIGESLGSKALALSIRRTRIGKYIPLGSRIGFWSRTY